MGGEPFSLPSVRSVICRNRETVHTLLREGGNSFKFFFFLFFFSIRSPTCFKDIVIDIDRVVIIIIIIYCYYYYYYYYYDIFIRSYFPGYLFSS